MSQLLPHLDGAEMTVQQFSNLSSIASDVSVESVAHYFGGRGYVASKKTTGRICRAIDEVSSLVTPKATYTMCPVSDLGPGKEMVFGKEFRLEIPDCSADPGARLVATAIGTLGDKLEKQCRLLANEGKIYQSTLFDAVGIALLDLLAEKICRTIVREGSRSALAKGFRFAPGLEGYPLEQQQLLFQIADNESVGVFLNSSAIMIPVKSISFFQILTETAVKSEKTDKCNSCRMTGCQYRMV